MSESKEYISSCEEAGNIHISEEVLASIAAAAALDVSGVSGLANQHGGDITEYLAKRGAGKSVRVQVVEEEKVAVDLSILMTHGGIIPEVGKAVQENVRTSIESMTGLEVAAVNLSVGGVVFPSTN